MLLKHCVNYAENEIIQSRDVQNFHSTEDTMHGSLPLFFSPNQAAAMLFI